jgi:prepilin-type N-terminal cleavage/methylation domain-containing protein
MKLKSGFTLIELLVVISIIGLLATLSVVSFNNAQVRTRDAKRVADIRLLVSVFTSANLEDATYVLCPLGCVGGPLGGNTNVKNIDICTTCVAGSAGKKTGNFTNLSNIKDPKNTGVCATVQPPTVACDYTVQALSTIASTTFGFTTEGGTATTPPPGINIGTGNYHYANLQGIIL